MRINQLPGGVKPRNETPPDGVALDETPECDLRIFKATYHIMRPYHVQAFINGQWRSLKFSTGKGRYPQEGFMAYQRARTALAELRRQVYDNPTPEHEPDPSGVAPGIGAIWHERERILIEYRLCVNTVELELGGHWDEGSRALRDRLEARLRQLQQREEENRATAAGATPTE